MFRMRPFLAVLRSFFRSSLLCTFSCHPSPPTILPSSLTSSCHLFLGLMYFFLPPFSTNYSSILSHLILPSISWSNVLFPATLLHQLFFHPLSPHLAIYFLVCLSIFLFPNSYIILFWEFYFLPFSVHAQTTVIYLTLLSLL